LPFIGSGEGKNINEISTTEGRGRIQQQIHFTYKKAKSFKYAWPIIQSILENEEQNLSLFLQNQKKWGLFALLGGLLPLARLDLGILFPFYLLI
jgi:hypothetical protein